MKHKDKSAMILGLMGMMAEASKPNDEYAITPLPKFDEPFITEKVGSRSTLSTNQQKKRRKKNKQQSKSRKANRK